MDQTHFLQLVVGILERLDLRYAITGSHASIAYGEARFTRDIDIVIALSLDDLSSLLSAFHPDEYYVNDIGAQQATRHGGMFNVIHPASGHKVDVIVPAENQPFDVLARRRRMPVSGEIDAWFVSPEDLILKKMQFFDEGGSDKHLRDIAGIVRVHRAQLDFAYIEHLFDQLHLNAIWRKILAEA